MEGKPKTKEELLQEKAILEKVLEEANKNANSLMAKKFEAGQATPGNTNEEQTETEDMPSSENKAQISEIAYKAREIKAKIYSLSSDNLQKIKNNEENVTITDTESWEKAKIMLDLPTKKLIGTIEIWERWAQNKDQENLYNLATNCLNALSEVMKVKKQEKIILHSTPITPNPAPASRVEPEPIVATSPELVIAPENTTEDAELEARIKADEEQIKNNTAGEKLEEPKVTKKEEEKPIELKNESIGNSSEIPMIYQLEEGVIKLNISDIKREIKQIIKNTNKIVVDPMGDIEIKKEGDAFTISMIVVDKNGSMDFDRTELSLETTLENNESDIKFTNTEYKSKSHLLKRLAERLIDDLISELKKSLEKRHKDKKITNIQIKGDELEIIFEQ